MVAAHSPAFARPYSVDDYGDYPEQVYAQDGMDLRTYIATKAMAAIIAGKYGYSTSFDADRATVAGNAVAYADALIAELNK